MARIQGVGLVIDRSRVRLQVGALPVNAPFHPSGVGKSSTSVLAGVNARRVHLCRVAGNTCDSIWQVTPRS